MAIKTSYPGVYIREERSGVQTISGVATSVLAAFGTAAKGPIGVPQRVFSFDGFDALFGDAPGYGELAEQMRQFFLNGGGTAWVTRVANGAEAARVRLSAEDQTPVLDVSAISAGRLGEQLQVEIDYDTPSPERTFNMTVYRRTLDSASNRETISDTEAFANLSMDPKSPDFVAHKINGVSAIVRVDPPTGDGEWPEIDPVSGASQSGLYFTPGAAEVAATVSAACALGSESFGRFNVSVDRQPAVPVTFEPPASDTLTSVRNTIAEAIAQALTDNGMTGAVTVSTPTTPAGPRLLRLESAAGPVVVTSAPSEDVAAALHLGAANGGIEWDSYSLRRPAPTGLVARPHANNATFDLANVHAAGGRVKNTFTGWTLTLPDGTVFQNPAAQPLAFPEPTGPLRSSPSVTYAAGLNVEGSLRAFAANLARAAASIEAHTDRAWTAALHGVRLVVRPAGGTPNLGLDAELASDTANILAALFAGSRNPANVNAYRLGAQVGPFVAERTVGNDGTLPTPGDYAAGYRQLARAADIFNILILPRAGIDGSLQSDTARAALWGPASAFCRERRAFLIVDPKSDGGAWRDVNEATGSDGVATLRTGVATDHAALYWPRLRITGPRGNDRTVDPCGSLAGLFARTDTNRGVWKAPAGLGAGLIGVRGLEYNVTDPENGVSNLAAINTNRLFPQGAVSWGARTMAGFENSGESDWRYVPVRRTALFIEESLYRGLRFAVFEPNAEPLWTQIRLAAGAFMNTLFRQGAFKGTRKDAAYYVLCDSTTTTQNDINLGIVNVRVGFAPLKPAEFVVVTIRQMAGQIET